ncbi:MAG: HAMP domain-containing histidine kinase [Bacteroidaceae bacterium]|nr:HAMP domain-containing histidine kinase [Bacteroidaceae bacterium]
MTWINNMTHVKVALVVVAFIIAGASLWVSNVLIQDLKSEERGNVAVWAEAMRALSEADENTDLNLVLKVINGNEYIPIVVLDKNGQVTESRNVEDSTAIEKIVKSGHRLTINLTSSETADSLAAPLEESTDTALTLATAEAENAAAAADSLTVCYGDSLMLTRLSQFPYVQLGIVGLFIAVAIFALLSSKRAEQNKVWVGLSRETAHQLGTPISSLMAWTQVLREQYPDDPLLPDMSTDVQRLQLIAERFSKIGSAPEMKPADLCEIVQHVVDYIHRRTSDRVEMTTSFSEEHMQASVCAPLFEWVIENLCKNAIDAMQGQGKIAIYVSRQRGHILVEVADTGKGIERGHFKDVFRPGFTTKKRGWGLGLSLAKRIVEEYHHGRIYVEASEIGKGTTFAIEIPQASDLPREKE